MKHFYYTFFYYICMLHFSDRFISDLFQLCPCLTHLGPEMLTHLKIGMLSFGNLHKANILSQFWYKKRFTVQASNDLWSMGKKLPLPSSLLRIWGFSSEAPVIWSFLSLIPDAQVQNPKFAFYHPILTKELIINYQDHRRMRDKRPKKMYHSSDK